MKRILILGIALQLLLFSFFALKPYHPAPAKDDSHYIALLQKVHFDSLGRAKKASHVDSLQRKIDSLEALARRLRAASTPKLDSMAGVKSVRRDSLICTDEKTYRRLVISSLNFGEEKYSLCLGQVAAKDSIIESFNADLGKSLVVAGSLNEGKKAITLQLESVKRQRINWFLSGIGAGIGASLLAIYLSR